MSAARPLRISIVGGFFLPVPPVCGGATEKIWHRLAQEFARAGHAVTFISRTWPGQPAEETVAGVRYRRVRGADHTTSLAANLAHDALWGLRVACALPPGDVVICHALTLPIWLPYLRPSAGHVAVVLGRSPKGQLRLYRGATRLFATSTEVANRVTAESPALGERTRVIWNPIDYWNLHAAAAQRGDPITIGFIGRIHPEKGLELLLRAASRLAGRTDLPAWRLEITGPAGIREGGGGESWRDGLIARFGPALGSRLVFHPAEFDAAKLARRYGQIDIFCYPSLAEKGETFGVAAAEAMAAGAVPVASALACFKDLIQDGENGLIFNHLAADADVQLEHALARLLADSDLRHAMAARAQSQVRRFDYAEVSAAIQRALREMVR